MVSLQCPALPCATLPLNPPSSCCDATCFHRNECPDAVQKSGWNLLWTWAKPRVQVRPCVLLPPYPCCCNACCLCYCFDCWGWGFWFLACQFSQLLVWQRVNHFRNGGELTKKDNLRKNLARYQVRRRVVYGCYGMFCPIAMSLLCGFQCLGGVMAAAFDIQPTTYVLPKEYLGFAEAFQKTRTIATAAKAYLEEKKKEVMDKDGKLDGLPEAITSDENKPKGVYVGTAQGGNPGQVYTEPNFWIIKPVRMSRGRGISIVNDVGDVRYGDHVVIQRYIPNPMLLDGYKFDLRLYVLVTSFKPLEAFIYRVRP